MDLPAIMQDIVLMLVLPIGLGLFLGIIAGRLGAKRHIFLIFALTAAVGLIFGAVITQIAMVHSDFETSMRILDTIQKVNLLTVLFTTTFTVSGILSSK